MCNNTAGYYLYPANSLDILCRRGVGGGGRGSDQFVRLSTCDISQALPIGNEAKM